MRRWTLSATGWALCDGQPVFYIWTMPRSGREYEKIQRERVVKALNRNESR